MSIKNKLLLSVCNLKLTTVNLSQGKPITTDKELTYKETPTVIQNKPKSLFPKPAREMIWKKINGQLVAKWISKDK